MMKKRIGTKPAVFTLAISLALTTGGMGTVAFAEDSADAATNKTVQGEWTGESSMYDHLTVALPSDPQELSPAAGGSGTKGYVFNCIYETLFLTNRENGDTLDPVIAKGYTVVDDLTWDVELYDYVYDAAGNHITASDVVFDYATLIDSGYAVKFDTYESCEAIDDYTVRFHWTEPIDEVDELATILGGVYVYSQAAYESGNFATAPVTTAQYEVKEFVSGSKVVVTLRDNYWQKPELIHERKISNVNTIEFQVVAEAAQNVIGLNNGTLDVSWNVPAEEIDQFRNNDAFVVEEMANSMPYYLLCNTDESNIFNDLNMRLAVYYALDHEAIAAVGGNSIALTSFGTPSSPDHVEMEEASYTNTCDPGLAAEYLEKAGYNGEEVVLAGANSEYEKNCLTMIQAQLINVGINVTIKTYDSIAIFDIVTDPTEYDIYFAYRGGSNTVTGLNKMCNWNEFGTGQSIGFVQDEKLQELYETANTIETHTDENMLALEEYIVENGYFVDLVAQISYIVHTSDMTYMYYYNSAFYPAPSEYK